MGTPDFAVPLLEGIVEQGHQVAAVYCRPPALSGRGMRQVPSPVHKKAEELGLPVETPKSFKEEHTLQTLERYQADVFFVCAYGIILPQRVLDIPRFGCLNAHASLLPRWRGAAPIQRALMAGDTLSGIGIMKMEAGLDTGPVSLESKINLPEDMTAGELHDRLSLLGAELTKQALTLLEKGELTFKPQSEEGVVYAHKIKNEDARIHWNESAFNLHNQIRGLSPFLGAFFEADFGKGLERVKVLKASLSDETSKLPVGALFNKNYVVCGQGALRLLSVQRSGKAPLPAEEFLRGVRLEEGTLFQ